MTRTTTDLAPPLQTFASHPRLTYVRFNVHQANKHNGSSVVSNLWPSGSEAETLPLGHHDRLQTWEVASQQCESYGWEESLTDVSMGYWQQPAWTPDLGDKFGDFGDEIWDLKGAGILSISLLGEEIRLNVLDDSM
ncbi:hypothetical protein AVEN_168446-1 [Araneus ventricosus]|uniref:Uncharacterized protein n=1 Tax=Araneus ventricosus TaxID=182803 RepID=A0A4Y2GT81_ARAVE|nr:hypothetical protein AVEN_168446-1 [Araneus ventricosus]